MESCIKKSQSQPTLFALHGKRKSESGQQTTFSLSQDIFGQQWSWYSMRPSAEPALQLNSIRSKFNAEDTVGKAVEVPLTLI